jgi:hypothetical protein
MPFKFVLPLPRFVFHPLTAGTIAAIHIYLAYGHLAMLATGHVERVHIWKGFGALFGAYVFATLSSRRMPALVRHTRTESNGGSGQASRDVGVQPMRY